MTRRCTYIVYAPHFDETSGGSIFLHFLAHRLNELGETALLWPWDAPAPPSKLWPKLRTNPDFNTPQAQRRDLTEDSVVIYPEVTLGNPLGAQNIVRWLLYTPGVKDPYHFTDGELFFKAGEMCDLPDLTGGAPDLFVWYRNPVYRNEHRPDRKGICYTLRKGKDKLRIPETEQEDAICIDGLSHVETAKVFNTTSTFYSYDEATFYSQYAALCGCLSIIVPGQYETRNDWVAAHPLGRFGVAYGDNDRDHALATMHRMDEWLDEKARDSPHSVRAFIKHTKRRWQFHTKDCRDKSEHTIDNMESTDLQRDKKALLSAAISAFGEGRMTDTYRGLMHALRLDSQDAQIFYMLSETCIRLGAIEYAEMYSSATLELDPTFKAALAVQIEVSVRQNDLDRARFLLTQYPAEGEHAPMHALLQQRVAFSEESFEASLVETALLVETDPKLIAARELFSLHFAHFMQSGHANRYGDFVDALGLHFDLSRPEERRSPWSEPGAGSIDIVIPVHNAVRDLADCLASIRRWPDPALRRIILVDDASDRVTKAWLDRYVAKNADVVLIRNTINLGFTNSVVAGIAQSDAPFFILLNSDTIVSPGWMTGLWRGLAADSSHAMAGPLSNSAYYQSISFKNLPREKSGREFAQMTEKWAAFVHAYGLATYPKVPFLSGFCLMLRRDHYETVGGLDATTYPRGYWEVQDLALRMIDIGLYPCLVDDIYVYHAQSGSIEKERRDKLVSEGFRQICARHGAIRVLAAEEICRHLPEVVRQSHGFRQVFKLPQLEPEFSEPIRDLPAHCWAIPLPAGTVSSDAEMCLFVAHAPYGQLADFTSHYLQELRQAGLKVVVCLAVDNVDISICDGWAQLADAVLLRENAGFDFGAWADLLRWLPELWTVKRLIFANDSVVGPFQSLSGMFERLRRTDAGFFALTDCTLHQYHAQSYFFGWSGRNLAAAALRSFWNNVENFSNKESAIHKYEIPLLALCGDLPDASHQILFGMHDIFGSTAETLPPFSPAHHVWQALLKSGNPFVKTAVLRDSAEAIDVLSELTGVNRARLRRHVELSNLNRL